MYQHYCLCVNLCVVVCNAFRLFCTSICPNPDSTEIQDLNLRENVGIHEQQKKHSTSEKQPRGDSEGSYHRLRSSDGVDQHRVHQPA